MHVDEKKMHVYIVQCTVPYIILSSIKVVLSAPCHQRRHHRRRGVRASSTNSQGAHLLFYRTCKLILIASIYTKYTRTYYVRGWVWPQSIMFRNETEISMIVTFLKQITFSYSWPPMTAAWSSCTRVWTSAVQSSCTPQSGCSTSVRVRGRSSFWRLRWMETRLISRYYWPQCSVKARHILEMCIEKCWW